MNHMMKTSMELFVSLLLLFFQYALPVSAQVTVTSSTTDGLSLAYRPGKADIDIVDIDGKQYTRISCDVHAPTGPSGSPSLPSRRIYFIAPGTTTPSIDISDLNSHVLSDVLIIPYPAMETDTEGFRREVYFEDSSHYALSGFRPRSHVALGERVDLGGASVWELVFSPVMFDAYGRKAALVDSLDIHISFSGSPAPSMLTTPLPSYAVNSETFKTTVAKRATSAYDNPFGSGDWYKITFQNNGMYSVSASALENAGFPIGIVKTDDIRIYYSGGWMIDADEFSFNGGDFREIAIDINDSDGDGIFDSGDSIIFFGESLSRFYTKENRTRLYYQNHAFTEKNVVWLTVSDDGEPLRFQPTGEIPDPGESSITSFLYNKHVENDYQLELITGGLEWYWEAIYNKNRQFTISTPGAVEGSSSTFRVGLLNQNNKRYHEVYLYINDQKPQLYGFSETKGFITHQYDGNLISGNNDFFIVRKYNPGESDVSVRLDYVEVEYERKLAFDENHMAFFYQGDGSSQKFVLSDVHRSSVTVYDTTDPYRVAYFDGVVYDNNDNTLTFQKHLSPDTPTRLLVIDPAGYRQVSSVTKKASTNARSIPNGANYIVITKNIFLDNAQNLADWRSRDSDLEPLTPMVVNFDDIVDEYNWGIYDPLAIRSYLKTVHDSGGDSRNYYCCIIGDTTYKYKNLTEEQAEMNFVPSYSLYDDYTFMELTTDDYFCWFDSNRLPAFSMGRLCATDKESARILVDKAIDYEKNPVQGIWHNRIMLIADDELTENGVGTETDHTVNSERLDDPRTIPSNIARSKIYLIEYQLENLEKPDATDAIIEGINEGYLLMNFVGHGNDDLLAHEHVIVGTRDIERFTNGGMLPLFTVFSCSVGKFTQLDNVSLAEILHLHEGGGTIGVIAGTNLTYSHSNSELNECYYKNLFDRDINPEYRIGHALRMSKIDLSGGSNPRFYMLFGDPATRLKVPRYGFSVATLDSLYRLQHLDLSGSITGDDGHKSYDGTLYISARGPQIHKTYTLANNTRSIDYTQPGRLFFKGEQHITGDTFNAELIVPKDLPSGGNEASINLFADGQEFEASGDINGFAIGGLYVDAPDDLNGPDIQLSFDGKRFDNGDYLSRQPSMTASIFDQSGVNIYGDRGHNITLLVDSEEMIVLTDRYTAVNGYTTGTVEYLLPILSPGDHTFEMNVYDSYNNASKLSVTANVVGSDTGDITIMNLLNYPNPMTDDGTAFTFSLTDDVRSAEIKIFSQAGRLVDSFAFSAGYGFNRVSWKPPFSIANGVYFYKLSVRSVNGRKASKIEKLVVMK